MNMDACDRAISSPLHFSWWTAGCWTVPMNANVLVIAQMSIGQTYLELDK